MGSDWHNVSLKLDLSKLDVNIGSIKFRITQLECMRHFHFIVILMPHTCKARVKIFATNLVTSRKDKC